MTRSGCFIRRLLAACVVVCGAMALPQMAFAQEAVLSGTVTDSSGGVLPGVTVTAMHTASGNSFLAVTDERGGYRVPVRIGRVPDHRRAAGICGRHQGRGTAGRADGRRQPPDGPSPRFRNRSPSPVKRRSSTPPRRPSAATSTRGRCRTCRSTVATGWTWRCSRPAAGRTSRATCRSSRQGYSQINIDGQQVTTTAFRHGDQTSRATAGRDRRVRGHHEPVRRDAGTVGGHARQRDHEVGHQQLLGHVCGLLPRRQLQRGRLRSERGAARTRISRSATTFGGPIKKDRIHFFGNYEYEREPQTVTFSSPYPAFNIDLAAKNRSARASCAVDVQFSPRTHLS